MGARFRPVTLRIRLVLALVALVTVGLAVFGIATYGLYARSQYQRLDDQLGSSVALVAGDLHRTAGLDASGDGGSSTSNKGQGGPNGGKGGPQPQIVVPPGTYAELRDATGAILANIQLSSSTDQPQLPSPLPAATGGNRFLTAGSTTGSAEWRVLVTADDTAHGSTNTIVVAIPTTEVTNALHRLVLIEVGSAAALVVILASGSWLILRRSLRPLEQMATTARSISAGALDQRVAPDDGRSEVGQLGLALNTMLGEIEAAFQEREATELRLRQFLADASHELRTPLTSIQGFAELFRLGADRDHIDLEVIMRRIEEESMRMKSLVDDLLLLARLDEPRPAERQPVDLAVLAADACSDAVATATNRQVTLDAPEPLVVQGDEDHLRQAIANLVTNALRHTPAGTPIEVGANLRDGRAVVTVRDHGGGLDDLALQHVFDRFWQADDARVGRGAGLGLAIVAAIAEEHDGTATATNAADGGALFTISLPATSLPATQSRGPEAFDPDRA
ncbi:MAG: two-component system, OmpR family, sensor kinase [Acidimicrobiaceae bacterium]